jgi:hypothetical protein
MHKTFYKVYTTMDNPYFIWRGLPDWTTRIIWVKFAPACRAPCPSWISQPRLTAPRYARGNALGSLLVDPLNLDR